MLHRGVGNVIVTQGDKEELIIEANPDLMPRIKTEVVAGTLNIKYEFEWMDYLGLRFIGAGPIRYFVTMKTIDGLSLSGAGNLDADKIETKELETNLTGAGNMTIQHLTCQQLVVSLSGAGSIKIGGKTGKQELQLSGAGSYNGEQLESEEATVRLSGVGSARIWVTKSLDASLSGAGSIDYYGSPQVEQRVSGIGGLHTLGNK